MKARVVWTTEEWSVVAARAEKIKQQYPDWSWLRIAFYSQDDLNVDRRRTTFQGTTALKPMFDILGLNELGKKPEVPAVVPAVETPKPEKVEEPTVLVLDDIPLGDLAEALFNRLEKLLSFESVIIDMMDLTTKTEGRITALEELVLKNSTSIFAKGEDTKPCATVAEVLGTQPVAKVEPEVRPVKIVIIGPMHGQFLNIERCVNEVVPANNLQLIYVDKDHCLPSTLPVADWCIVNRHMSHTTSDKCKSRYNGRTIRLDTAGIDTVKKTCLDCYSRTRSELKKETA